MSKISRKAKEKNLKSYGHHHTFLSRITKTLYYGKLPSSDRLSLPVTEFATELFSEAKTGKSLERLHYNDAAAISRNACVSPCSFILAMLYLERLKTCNPDYLQRINPSELFLVSLMVSSKFLYDDGEEDEVFIDEWAISGGLSVKELVQLEKEFLNAINWEVFVSEATFWKKLNNLEQMIAKKEGINRGWFTYTELNNILSIVDIYHLYHFIASLMVVLLATYTAGNCLQPTIATIERNDTSIHIVDKCHDEIFGVNMNENIEKLKKYNCDFENTSYVKKQIDAADVLKTGLILAAIKPALNRISDSNKSNYVDDITSSENSEKISWDWWSSPTMKWLTSTSGLAEKFNFVPNFGDYVYLTYLDSVMVTSKIVEQENHVHKATRTRMQDQLERSWHKEWTDVIKSGLFVYDKPFELLQKMKT